MKLRSLFLICGLLVLAYPVQASRFLTTFGPTNVYVNGTDSLCGSYTNSISGTSIFFTCVPGGGGGGNAPTNCSTRINNGVVNITLPSSGGNANLSVVGCTGTGTITYNWIKNGVSGVNTTSSWTDSFPTNPSTTNDVTYNYQSQSCIGTSCSTTPASPISVTVSKTSGGGWTGTCPGFTNTWVVDMNWASPTRMVQAMGPTDIIVVRFTTGSGTTPANNLSKIGGAEYDSPPSARYAVLSATPCDFAAQPMPGASTSGTSVTVPFALGGGNNFGYYPSLLNNTTYYFNVKNFDGAACVAGGVCRMFFDLTRTI